MNRLASKLALGTVQWGLDYGVANRSGRPDDAEVQRIVSMGWRGGLTTLDTARAYGEAEAVVGRVMAREQTWRVVTKLSPAVQLDEANASMGAAQRSIAESRAALGLKTIDVMLLHRAIHRVAHDGVIWEQLLRARAEGFVAQVGISATHPTEALHEIEVEDVEVMQVASSLLDQRLARANFFERARHTTTEVHLRSVFLQGVAFLEDDDLPPHLEGLRAPLERIDAWCARRQTSRHAAFLAYALSLDVSQVVVGVEKAWQLASHLELLPEVERILPEIQGLALSLPDIDDDLVDPSRWPPL